MTMLHQRTHRLRRDTFTCAKEHGCWQDAAIIASSQHALSTYYYI